MLPRYTRPWLDTNRAITRTMCGQRCLNVRGRGIGGRASHFHRRAIPCHAMPRHATPRRATPRRAAPRHATSSWGCISIFTYHAACNTRVHRYSALQRAAARGRDRDGAAPVALLSVDELREMHAKPLGTGTLRGSYPSVFGGAPTKVIFIKSDHWGTIFSYCTTYILFVIYINFRLCI